MSDSLQLCFAPAIAIDARNEYDCERVCAAIEAAAVATITAMDQPSKQVATLQLCCDLTAQFQDDPITADFLTKSDDLQEVQQQRLQRCGYEENDNYSRMLSLELLSLCWLQCCSVRVRSVASQWHRAIATRSRSSPHPSQSSPRAGQV